MTQSPTEQRKIIHVDMDAFFASVEQRDHPELRGRPVVVGGEPESRGVVATASYEARRYGIHSAMSSRQARRLCPHAVFLKPNFDRYQEVSHHIRTIFEAVTPLVEPLSLDEAYLDVTENRLGERYASKIARYLKDRIRDETGLTASAGVGPSKFIAKIASDLRKPDGLVVIPPSKVLAFLEKLPVEKIWGVGPVTAKRLQELGLNTAGDIRRCEPSELVEKLGKYGAFLHELACGIDERPVEPSWERKSYGTEHTFEKDILTVETLQATLDEQVQIVAEALHEMDCLARTLTLKVRYSDFTTITRSRTLFHPSDRAPWLYRAANELMLETTEAGARPIRLLGVSASGLIGREEPLQLWLDLPLP